MKIDPGDEDMYIDTTECLSRGQLGLSKLNRTNTSEVRVSHFCVASYYLKCITILWLVRKMLTERDPVLSG